MRDVNIKTSYKVSLLWTHLTEHLFDEGVNPFSDNDKDKEREKTPLTKAIEPYEVKKRGIVYENGDIQKLHNTSNEDNDCQTPFFARENKLATYLEIKKRSKWLQMMEDESNQKMKLAQKEMSFRWSSPIRWKSLWHEDPSHG